MDQRLEGVAVTDWAPATEAEAAMRDALRVGDQEQYFRILARIELLLPIASDSIGGESPAGWGTWTAGERTHVLAFTSPGAMRACLAEHAGSARRTPFRELAASWPNLEWWLAVNPGLPVEGYLPAWFVSQLARGDVRLPGRSAHSRSRMERAESLGRARVAVPNQGRPDQPGPDQGRPDRRPEDPAVPGTPPLQRSTPPVGSPGPVPARPPGPSSPAPLTPVSPAPVSPASVSPASVSPAPVSPAPVSPAPMASGPVSPAPAPAFETQASEPRSFGSRTAESPPLGASVPAAAVPATGIGSPTRADLTGFVVLNDLERELLAAHQGGSTGTYLSALLLAKVLLPLADGADPTMRPGDAGFAWRTDKVDDQVCVTVFTALERVSAHTDEPLTTAGVKFVQMIRSWPDETWSLAVNPGTPLGVVLPGGQITALAASAAEVGLGDDPGEANEPASAPPRPVSPGNQSIRMQKVVAPGQVSWYLERGYDRVCGFVHREQEVLHLRTPAALIAGLGLRYPGSPFDPAAEELYILRWPAFRHSLYRIPYGGRTEEAMTAMEGWMIERPPFRGNGFAPTDSGDVIAEFKLDSIRLPHGAQLWRVTREGAVDLVATLDADEPAWRRAEEEATDA